MNKFMKKIMKKSEGFTLVELIVVIAILAILAGVAVPVYSGYIKSANKTADNQVLEAYNTAISAALAMEGEDGSDATGYFSFDAGTLTLTPVDKNGNQTAGHGNDVWDNFVQFYGLDDGDVSETIVLDYYTTVTFSNGELLKGTD